MDAMGSPIDFDVRHRFTGAVQFTARIKCQSDEPDAVKLRLAVTWALASGAALKGIKLYYANLSGADLRGIDMRGIDLRGVDLRGADLSGVDMSYTNLHGVDMSYANLSGVDMSYANLSGSDMSQVNLTNAILRGASMAGANLSGVDLCGANMAGANLSGVDLRGAELAIARTRILPDGDLIGWKKCQDDVIVKLRIPADARRSHAFGRKCRAEFVDVLEVIGAEAGTTAVHGPETQYRVGDRVYPDCFDENWWNECSNGIHFFITRAEAEAY